MSPGITFVVPDTAFVFASESTLAIIRSQAGVVAVIGGAFTAATSIQAGTFVACATASFFSWGATLNRVSAPADGQVNFANFAVNAGVGFDFATDALLKLRTRAQTGYATLDVLGLKASGAAGASGTGTVVSQLTVVNGIVTSCTIA